MKCLPDTMHKQNTNQTALDKVLTLIRAHHRTHDDTYTKHVTSITQLYWTCREDMERDFFIHKELQVLPFADVIT